MQLLAALSVVSVSILPLPAHAALIDSTVEDGGTLSEAVDSLSITMNEEILQVPGVETANVLTLRDDAGNYYGDGCVEISGSTASTDAALGEAGDYVLSYTVVSADTHPVSGDISFTWEPPQGYEASPALPEAPVCGEAPADPIAPEATEENGEDTNESAETEDSVDTEETEAVSTEESTDEGGVPTWVFLVVSIAAVVLIVALIIGNWVRARRMRALTGEDSPTGNDPADANGHGDESGDAR